MAHAVVVCRQFQWQRYTRGRRAHRCSITCNIQTRFELRRLRRVFLLIAVRRENKEEEEEVKSDCRLRHRIGRLSEMVATTRKEMRFSSKNAITQFYNIYVRLNECLKWIVVVAAISHTRFDAETAEQRIFP